ncbi:MAG TPA: phytanoyl-CoA dioxygenase family protein, partial [Flavisolibacter sp.]|nr:phytanoyl-CoA dioxygenase family protein [Flavisolibacter sp.]
FTSTFNRLVAELFGSEYFVVKSIYFDKPEQSNWFVSCHQDLTISVDQKIHAEGYRNWTTKENRFAVQPPTYVLKDNFTVLIHLDDANEENGALRVIPASHRKGVYRPETIDRTLEMEEICAVPKGGVMIMKPLLLHSSNRTTNNKKRRVIHLEFSKSSLPEGLRWAEYLGMKSPDDKTHDESMHST